MEIKETEINIELNDEQWKMVDRYFTGYTHVEVNDIPEKFIGYVVPTRNIMREKAILKIKYCGIGIDFIKDEEIHLENEKIYKGKIISKAYQNADTVVSFVASVVNINEILNEHEDIMETFFLEFWAVSMLGVARNILVDRLNTELSNEKRKVTSIWSPGQSKFALQNQIPLFEILKPETIGVTLDEYQRMIPLKTVSGTMGVVYENDEQDMISCDYCEHAKTCPGYVGKTFEGKDMNRRLM